MVLTKDRNTSEFINICYFISFKIDYYNNESKYDINKDLEKIGIILFKYIYKYDLIDLNIKKKNHPAIDLAELTKFVGIQVTSTDTKKKINETIEKFFKYKLNEQYFNGLKILIFKFDNDEDLKEHAANKMLEFPLKKKQNVLNESFIEVIFILDLVNKFNRLKSVTQSECLRELNKEVVKPLINRLNYDEEFIVHESINANKVREYYEEEANVLEDLNAIQNKLSSLSFETRVLLYDLIYLAYESDDIDETDIYLLNNVGNNIKRNGLQGNLDELILNKLVKTQQELYVKDQDAPLEVAILKFPIKNKERYIGWGTLKTLLTRDEVLRMVQFLDFRVLDN